MHLSNCIAGGWKKRQQKKLDLASKSDLKKLEKLKSQEELRRRVENFVRNKINITQADILINDTLIDFQNSLCELIMKSNSKMVAKNNLLVSVCLGNPKLGNPVENFIQKIEADLSENQTVDFETLWFSKGGREFCQISQEKIYE